MQPLLQEGEMSPSQAKQKKAEVPFQTLLVPKSQRCWDCKNPHTGTPEWPHCIMAQGPQGSQRMPIPCKQVRSCSDALLHLLCLPTLLQAPENVAAFLTA